MLSDGAEEHPGADGTVPHRPAVGKAACYGPGSPEAYLKGWQILREKRGTNWFPRSVELLQQAVDIDPNYALAYSALALAHGMIQTPLPAKEKMPKAKAYALKALQLDDQLAEAHTHLAYVRFLYDWDRLSAEAGFKRALQLNPSYASGYSLYARYVMAVLGKKDDAIKLCQNLGLPDFSTWQSVWSWPPMLATPALVGPST